MVSVFRVSNSHVSHFLGDALSDVNTVSTVNFDLRTKGLTFPRIYDPNESTLQIKAQQQLLKDVWWIPDSEEVALFWT